MAGEARKADSFKHHRDMTRDELIARVDELLKNNGEIAYYFIHELDRREAETREQCAQIAESYAHPEAKSDASFGKKLAAAIRSIAQQDSANEGAKDE